MWDVRINKTSNRLEKRINSAKSLYWRSVEDQNCILLDVCVSTCRRSNLSWDIQCVVFQYYFVVCAHKVPIAKIAKFLLQGMKSRGWSCCSSIKMSNMFMQKWHWRPRAQLLFSNVRHALPSWQKHPLSQKIQNYANFDRTARQNDKKQLLRESA